MARRPVNPQFASRMQSTTLGAPTGGWVTNAPLAASRTGTARVLENWFPTQTGVRPRGGTKKHATVHATNEVVSMFNYAGPGSDTLFAATDDSVFDISSPSDADTPPTASLTGRNSGYYSFTHLVNISGTHLYAVNGTDKPIYYDGTTIVEVDGASTPAITGVTTSDLVAVWTYANRLFFIKKDSATIYYLPVDSIGGAATSLDLAGSLKKGGRLLFGASWSMDAGDGLDDKCVIISDRGEAIVAAGSDPSDPTSWQIVGVYDIGVPLGNRAWFRIGGELMVMTAEGIVPMSQTVQSDRTQLSLGAITRAIEPDWREAVDERSTKPWEAIRWPEENMLVVSQPVESEGDETRAFVANLESRAWCKYTPIDVNCLGRYNNRIYFGTSSGTVHEMEVTGNDDGALYTCTCVLSDENFGMPGGTKTVRQARATFRATHDVIAALSASTDYEISLPAAPSSIADFSADVWDTALWDEGIWDAGRGEFATKTTRWQSIGRTGYSFLMAVRVTMGISSRPNAEMVSLDVTYEGGGLVV